MESQLIQLTLEVLIQVLVPVIVTAFAIPLIKAATEKIKASIDKDDLAFADTLIRKLVLAAEQKGLKDQLFQEGAAKRDWVICEAEKALSQRGIALDLDEIYHLLEANVLESLNVDKLYEADAVVE
jgi:hypothetical protein